MVANNYPIIKYPQAIADKLIAQEFITMLRSDTTPVQLPLPNIYHRHFGSPAHVVISVAYLNNWSETEII